MLNDPVFQVTVVGFFANAAGAAVALYLWNQERSERYLLFWGLAWLDGTLRWLIHVPGYSIPMLRVLEGAVLFPLLFFFNAIGSYDLLPNKPWRSRNLVMVTGALLLAYGIAANLARMPIEGAYLLAAFVFTFNGACLWLAYRGTGLSGHAIASVVFIAWSAWFIFGLTVLGRSVATSIIGPLFNIPLALSMVVIAFQRRGKQLAEKLTELQQAEREVRAAAVQTRQLFVRLANVEDEERRVLHSELHDQVGANLAALRLELDIAEGMLADGERPDLNLHLNSAREVTTETIGMARDLMADLRPPALDDYGLVAALRTFAESQSLRLQLSVAVVGEDLAPRPTPLVESALFRIVREAVVNAARHASASTIIIAVSAREARIVVTIEDDGVGFDPDAPNGGRDHWGLKNMRERASAIGGTLQVQSTRNRGTRVTADAPREAV